MRTRRVINWQKIFIVVSLIFLISCILFYGGRFIYFYTQNNKQSKSTENKYKTLGETIINSNINSINFKKINNEYYFINNAKTNYIKYSNILWRIFKIDKNNNIYLITDNSITSLAYGEGINNYNESYLYKWLNKSDDAYTGILENNLTKTNDYLIKSEICIDTVDDPTKVKCDNTYNEANIGLLSITDYINTGGQKSFINTKENVYLSNPTSESEIWYLTEEGKLNKSDGTDIFGIKPIITLNKNVKVNKGIGSSKDPYTLEEKDNIFGSYVKLDNDIWRIYEVNDNEVKLMLNDYLTMNNQKASYIYGNYSYYHNDEKTDSLAYYLNTTYLDSLSYKDKILSSKYVNGQYDTNYNYAKILDTKIDTKVSLISIGNIILNNKLTNVWTNTGMPLSNVKVYTLSKSSEAIPLAITTEANIVPCITIDKSILTKGDGSKKNPLTME